MKLIIFGAGASFDSIHSYYDINNDDNNVWKPPLANEIFSNRYKFIELVNEFKGAMSLKSEIVLHNDLEEYFQELWEFASENKDELTYSKLINTQYYFQRLFMEISDNYSLLGNSNYDVITNFAYKYSKKINEDVLFVSFNYDLLLDYAIERILNIKFKDINDYIKHPIKYIKPHGSCNWFINFKRLMGSGAVYNMGGTNKNAFMNSLYIKKVSNKTIEWNLENKIVLRKNFYENSDIGLPQLLIPLKKKDDFIMPSEHLSVLEENLPKVDDILIVGWKGTEAKFVGLLNKHLGNKSIKITTVNHEDKTIEQEMKKAIPRAVIEAYSYKPKIESQNTCFDTFTNFVQTQVEFRNQPEIFFK